MHRTPPPPINSLVRIRDERWRVTRSHAGPGCSILDVTGADAFNRGSHASFVLPFDDCAATGPPRPVRVTRRGWRRLARRSLACALPSPLALRTAVESRFDALPYQLEPALAYIRGGAVRLLIADAVGLGKTVEAGLLLAEMLARSPDGRALVVVPAGLREQWRDELHMRFAVDAAVLDAAGLWRLASQLPPGMNPWSLPSVVITSIDFIKRPEVLRALEPLVWHLVVFDEAHALAGSSDRHRAAAGLAARSRAVVLLTATPHSGDEPAFARLCSLGDIHGRFPLVAFRRTRATRACRERRRTFWTRLTPSPAEQQLRERLVVYARQVWTGSPTPGARLAMIVLLKRAASSPTALARSLERRARLLLGHEALPDPAEQLLLPWHVTGDDLPPLELGAPGLGNLDVELGLLGELLDLARAAATCAGKPAVLRRLLRRTTETAVVFTQYRDTLDELAEALSDVPTALIHGGLSSRERAAAARRFTDGPARVLLATDAASEGLNLQKRCRLVINVDLPWTPLRLEQRIGRVDRLGQRRTVHAWQMMASGTYEEAVAARVRSRQATASAAFDQLEADDDAEAAEVLLTGREIQGRRLQLSGLVRADPALAQIAAAEAARIVQSRGLMARAATTSPAGAFYVRARASSATRAVLAFRALFTDPEGRQVWEALLGSEVRLMPSGTASLDWLHVAGECGAPAADASAAAALAELLVWRRAAAAVLRRDRAIASMLRATRARLSAALSQPGLFSTRRESSTTPQLQVLEESLARLRRASADMRAVGAVRLEEVSLVCAAAIQER